MKLFLVLAGLVVAKGGIRKVSGEPHSHRVSTTLETIEEQGEEKSDSPKRSISSYQADLRACPPLEQWSVELDKCVCKSRHLSRNGRCADFGCSVDEIPGTLYGCVRACLHDEIPGSWYGCKKKNPCGPGQVSGRFFGCLKECPTGQIRPYSAGMVPRDCICESPHQFMGPSGKCEYCADGHQLLNNKCKACPVGTSRDSLSDSPCVECQGGHVANIGESTCHACSSSRGTSLRNEFALNQTHCWCQSPNEIYIPRDRHCAKPCPVDTQAVFENDIQKCQKCPFGTLNERIGGVCEPCNDGYILDHSYHGIPFCKKCPSDSASVSEGSVSHSTCRCHQSTHIYHQFENKCLKKCPRGKELVSVAYKPMFRSNTVTPKPSCKLCGANQINPDQAEACIPCLENTVGTNFDRTECVCQSGFVHAKETVYGFERIRKDVCESQ